MPGATRLKSIGLLTDSGQNRLLCVRFSFFCLRRVLFGFASSFSQTGYLFLFLLTPRHFLLPLLECLTCHKASSGCRHRDASRSRSSAPKSCSVCLRLVFPHCGNRTSRVFSPHRD